ncbi:DUF58 domain-containing protein [Blastopirellula retiformator]|uniref:DUF58 domain-containing protein n=1 Tax=Blastopirellula retiformator TaxID=2527970 RepID=A0A5C5UV10_9BACT|nr:DUF58 domain-containing protein [Blastopirellula retiformator]TWT29639.1 hypothetical protein Enr8_48270 [Blastopirellula retiformator]
MPPIRKLDGAPLGLRQLLTRDYTPWANRYVYWLRTPFGVLIAAAVVSLVLGWFVTPQSFVIFGAIAGVLAIGICWPWIGLRGVGCSLRFPRQRCEEEEEVAVEVEIVNRWPFPVWGLAIERGFFHSEQGEREAVVSLARIPGWTTCRFSFTYRPMVRGVYPTTPPSIATEFPFGLWKASRPTQVAQSLIVWPRVFPLTSLELPSGNCRQLLGASDTRSGDHGDRTGARPYRLGDSLRNVHWAQTARCDRLIVSERQEAAQTAVTVVIDSSQSQHRGVGRDATLEWSLRIGLSVAAALVKQNVTVHVALGGQTHLLDGRPASWRRLLDTAAQLTPSAATPTAVSANGLVIGVRTDLAPSTPRESRAIVLRTNEESDARAEPKGNWIELDAREVSGAKFQEVWNRRRKKGLQDG